MDQHPVQIYPSGAKYTPTLPGRAILPQSTGSDTAVSNRAGSEQCHRAGRPRIQISKSAKSQDSISTILRWLVDTAVSPTLYELAMCRLRAGVENRRRTLRE